MAKDRVNITLDSDIKEKLKQYADERHSSVSQVVTDWVLTLKVKDSQVRGQMTFK